MGRDIVKNNVTGKMVSYHKYSMPNSAKKRIRRKKGQSKMSEDKIIKCDFNAFGLLGILLVLQLDIPWEWKGMLSLLYLISSLNIEEEKNNG